MKINKKLLTIAVLILAVVFTTACNDNKKKIEILKIDGIWVDSIGNEDLERYCPGSQNYILIPSHVPKNSDINIKLYGCWDDAEAIIANQVFHGFKSNKTDNKIELTAYKEILNEEAISSGYFSLGLGDEYNITNDFEPGEIEFVVKNPDNEELKETITIE